MNTHFKRLIALVLTACAFVHTQVSANDGLDTSFGFGGITELNLSNSDSAQHVKVGTNGSIYLLGATDMGVIPEDSDTNRDYSNMFIARYLSDGTLDPTFGGFGGSPAGVVVSDVQLSANPPLGFVPMDDGTIIAFTANYDPVQTQLVMLRYLENGLLDASFGNLGKKFFGVPAIGGSSSGAQLVDGQLVVWSARFAARFELDGTLDPTFGVNAPLRRRTTTKHSSRSIPEVTRLGFRRRLTYLRANNSSRSWFDFVVPRPGIERAKNRTRESHFHF